MGLLENYTGIGMSPRPTIKHQSVMFKLATAINDNIDTDDHEVLTESVIDIKRLDSQAPDVILYELPDYTPVLIIEVTTTRECAKIMEKVRELIKKYDTVQEAYIYDYELKLWQSFGPGADMDDPSYSPMLEIDLDDYL